LLFWVPVFIILVVFLISWQGNFPLQMFSCRLVVLYILLRHSFGLFVLMFSAVAELFWNDYGSCARLEATLNINPCYNCLFKAAHDWSFLFLSFKLWYFITFIIITLFWTMPAQWRSECFVAQSCFSAAKIM